MILEELGNIASYNYEELIDRAKKLEDKEVQAKILCDIGSIECFKHHLDNALSCYEQAQRIYVELKDATQIASCLTEEALIHYLKDSKRLIRTHTLFNDAAYLVNNIEDYDANQVKSKIMHYNGLVCYGEKNFSEALNSYKKAFNFTDEKSLQYGKILDSLGLFYMRSSNFHIAIKYLDEAIDIKKSIGDELEIATTSLLRGRYFISTESYTSALEELTTALEMTEKYEDVFTSLRIYDEIAKIYLNQNDLDNMEKYLAKAMNNCAEGSEYPVFAYLNCTVIQYLVKKDNIPEAIKVLEGTVIPIFEKHPSVRGEALIKQLKSIICLKLHRMEEALELLHQALDLYHKIKLYFEEAKCYFELAKVYKTLNNPKLVVANLLEALSITTNNELPLLNKKIEDFLYEIDSQEWANIINKTAKKEKLFEESKSLLETLDLLEVLNDQEKQTKDPLLALLRLGRSIASQTDIDRLIEVIAQETKIALNSDRCTVFLYDKEKNELWSKVALGMGSKEIRIPATSGLAGYVVTSGETINIKDAYSDERFNKEIDKSTGYTTQSILCMPIKNMDHKIIGVFQVLNKQGGKYFTNEDEDLLISIGSSASIALENASLFTKQQQMFEEQKKSFSSFINTLAASLDARDKITAGHSIRVTEYTSLVAKQMSMSFEEIEVLEKAALLHDIGKIGIKDSVLSKEGKLTDEEYAHIQQHASITADILDKMYFTENLKDVPIIASSHHEKYDGTGYFRRETGKAIPIGGRILAVSDVFDAITSKRHYRDRMPFMNVLSILDKDKGTHFDPDVVDVFFSISTDKILKVLISAYDKDLSDEEKDYFSKYKIKDLFNAYKKPEEEKLESDKLLIKRFEALYLNEEIKD